MLMKLLVALGLVRRVKTFDEITSVFNQVSTDLSTLVNDCEDKIEDNVYEIMALKAENEALASEQRKAINFQVNLTAFLGQEVK